MQVKLLLNLLDVYEYEIISQLRVFIKKNSLNIHIYYRQF